MAILQDPGTLLARERAAEHIIFAIAHGREDLITNGVLQVMGAYTKLERSEQLPAWEFGDFTFAMSGTVAALGAAAVVTAPLEIPTLFFGSAAYTATHVLSALMSTGAEVRRVLAEDEFRRAYGIARDSLEWSLLPAATLFWYLSDGDTVLEMALKAKRGPLGLGSNHDVCARVLGRLFALLPGSVDEKCSRLQGAVEKAQSDMGLAPSDPTFAPAAALLRSLTPSLTPSLAPGWGPAAGVAAVATPAGMVTDDDLQPTGRAGHDRTCSVCLEASRTHAVTPCGHRCLCSRCANLDILGHTCPICRGTAHGLLRIYDP